MQYNPSIFKAYDIRGVYGQDFDEEFAYQLGHVYYRLRREELGRDNITVVVAHDMRLSSPVLYKKLVQGLLEAGAQVIEVGLIPTPTFYFAVAHYHYDGGIMVSASHNPKEYNGFKLVRQLASPMGLDSGLTDLRGILTEDNSSFSVSTGTITKKDNIVTEQVNYDWSVASPTHIKPYKIVIDTANAMGALYFDELLSRLPSVTVEKMNWELDGSFPAHEADPFKAKNIKQLCARVQESGADLGIATDGDSDRIFFVTNTGEAVEPGITRAIMAKIFLADHPGATIGYDIRPGKITYDTIVEHGGEPLVTRVGHSLIKEAMIDTGAYFAGEASGHFFLNMGKEGCYEVPGIITLKLLEELSQSGLTLADYIKPYQKYAHSGEINIRVNNGLEKIAALKEKYQAGKINELDGLTVEYPEVWFNVRLSNTEPLLRLNIEATTPEIMEAKKQELLTYLQS